MRQASRASCCRGSARSLQPDARVTWCQETENACRVDLAVDIFAMGILLWELVTGDLPIKGAMRDVQVPAECPVGIKNLIVDCMRGRASDRPSAAEVGPCC